MKQMRCILVCWIVSNLLPASVLIVQAIFRNLENNLKQSDIRLGVIFDILQRLSNPWLSLSFMVAVTILIAAPAILESARSAVPISFLIAFFSVVLTTFYLAKISTLIWPWSGFSRAMRAL